MHPSESLRSVDKIREWTLGEEVSHSITHGVMAAFALIALPYAAVHAYLVGGGGVVYTETSAAPNRTVNPAFDLGLGFRFVVKDFMAVNVALINTTYVDTPTGTTKGVTQNLMLVNAGVSIFFPFKSTYRED